MKSQEMEKDVILRVNFDSLKKSIIALSSSEKKELLMLLEENLFESELNEPMGEYLLSESSLKKDWDKKEEDEAWKDL
ncbi:hypothetical protein MM236_01580 [Belliella sp. DSM 107340]|uniref:DUF2281 domain-containing protein n=2 Tax=Belliella TaxID=232244 RepID=A0ABS9UJ51_9BACT|nr:hypothetical protein [Belliella calami]MCH7396652.1 hypothetical protein [Belliella calami]